MSNQKNALLSAASGFILITLVFVATITPLEGFSIATFPMILGAIGLWICGCFFLIRSIIQTKGSVFNFYNILTFLLVIAFIPVGWQYIKTSGRINTEVKIQLTNISKKEMKNVMVYGDGSIFEGADTFKLKELQPGNSLTHKFLPVTKPHRTGFVLISYSVDDTAFRNRLTEEFTVNPYSISQEWVWYFDGTTLLRENDNQLIGRN